MGRDRIPSRCETPSLLLGCVLALHATKEVSMVDQSHRRLPEMLDRDRTREVHFSKDRIGLGKVLQRKAASNGRVAANGVVGAARAERLKAE